MSAGPDITVEDAGENLLVGIDGDGFAASACLDADASSSDIDEALADLSREVQHYTDILGGRSP